MSSTAPSMAPAPSFDSWQSLTAGVYLAIVGYTVTVGIPVISTAWVSLLGFSEAQVGRVAGADLGGLSIGSVIAAMLAARMNRQLLIYSALGIAAGANVLCLYYTDYSTVLALRLLAGIGSGLYTGMAIATLGASSKPAKALNLLLFVFAFSQAAEVYFLPKMPMNGIYGVFIITNLIGFLVVRWVPPRPVMVSSTEPATAAPQPMLANGLLEGVPRLAPWLVLAAVALSYLNIGAYWTYIELAAAASPTADPDWVGNSLVIASFCSILGCLVATVLSDRFGLARPLIVSMFCHALVVIMLAAGINNVNIFISLFSFNFLWVFIDVYQAATIANVDKSGRYVALVPAAQGLGQILGPNIAASILAYNLGYAPVFIMAGAASFTGMLIYGYMYLRLRRAIPILADAS
ncbi:MAG: MFS transporter [Pseudomonadota bacterium]